MLDYEDLGKALGKGRYLDEDVEALLETPKEVVIEADTGRIRQAGSTPAIAGVEQQLVEKFRSSAERNLYVFVKGVMQRQYLVPALHLSTCQFLTDFSKVRRKLLLLPREHCKSTIVAQSLPIHILIQPRSSNIYFKDLDGSECRIVLACETIQRAGDHLRVIENAWEQNELLRGLWPQRAWERPSRDARVWNAKEMVIPRRVEYPDPSIRALGVDAAVTGAHPNVLIKDDLISLEAANSPAVMATAIKWHIVSRALINKPGCLEFTDGTRWAIYDLYHYMITEDKSVEILKRSIIEDGAIIYPEIRIGEQVWGFSWEKIGDLQKEFGPLFSLLYMNEAADPSLVDFDASELRYYAIEDGKVAFVEDERDERLASLDQPIRPALPARGEVLNDDSWSRIVGKDEYLRFVRAS